MSRPLFHRRIDELEAEFQDRLRDREYLQVLYDELLHRSSDRSVRLRNRVEAAQRGLRATPPTAGGVSQHQSASPRAPGPPARIATPPVRPEPRPQPKPSASRLQNSPNAILDSWIAMEVLTPASPFRRPEDLRGDRGAVARLDRGALPWENGGERARPRTRLYYQVVLGSIDLPAAFEALHQSFTDSREEAPRARGQAVLAIVILDQRGCVVDSPAAMVSSFGWALPRALRGELRELAAWREAEQKLVERLENLISRRNGEGDPLPVDRRTLVSAFEWLIGELGLDPSVVTPPGFAIRSYQAFRNPDPPEPVILNSFFLNDLSVARSLAAQGRMTPNLRRYLGVDVPPRRRDLLHDRTALEQAVAPDLIPPARWPGRGRHPLVMLQQAAVNLGIQELAEEGILAVNGPPGTGKTTLLRDLVAAVVTSRAERMATFDDPARAFTHSGDKIRAGQGWIHLYRVDSSLRGSELIVASSNNKAVENVSAELPARGAIADDAPTLRYFPLLSDAVLGRETWGLVAAVLGNAENRYRFTQSFWWDEEVGLSTYLSAAAGTPKMVEGVDPETGEAVVRLPKIVADEDPPRSQDDALRRWRDARKTFRARLSESRARLKSLARVRTLAAALPQLARAESDAHAMLLQRKEEEQRVRSTFAEQEELVAVTRQRAERMKGQLAAHDRERPGFFARLFGTAVAQCWKRERKSIASAAYILEQNLGARSASLASIQQELRSASAAVHSAEAHSTEAGRQHSAARQEVQEARQRIGSRFLDAELLGLEHEVLQCSVPWVGDEEQRLRDEVFEAGVHLHRAFIDAAAKPLRHNLV